MSGLLPLSLFFVLSGCLRPYDLHSSQCLSCHLTLILQRLQAFLLILHRFQQLLNVFDGLLQENVLLVELLGLLLLVFLAVLEDLLLSLLASESETLLQVILLLGFLVFQLGFHLLHELTVLEEHVTEFQFVLASATTRLFKLLELLLHLGESLIPGLLQLLVYLLKAVFSFDLDLFLELNNLRGLLIR